MFLIKRMSKYQMDSLYLLQFACFIFMLINAFIIGITHLHVKWENKRYERARWMILAAMLGMAAQYFVQMTFGFRAADDDLGAVVNILIYTPCFTLISMGIYSIETTRANRRKMNAVCGIIYAAIIVAFGIGVCHSGSLRIGAWLYVMLVLFGTNVVYCIYIITKEMVKRRYLLETMSATDMLPYVRHSRASFVILFLASLVMPFAILSTTLLFIVGPIALLALLFFNLTFVALGNSYIPTEELLDKEEQKNETIKADKSKSGKAYSGLEKSQDMKSPNGTESVQRPLSDERKAIIEQSLDKWCAELGYKDCTVNMLTLSRSLCISKDELTQYFDQCLNSTFRIWLSDIRFKAAQKMMREYPDYSNDIISAECGFTSRTYLYRIFKERTGKTPTEWREKVST